MHYWIKVREEDGSIMWVLVRGAAAVHIGAVQLLHGTYYGTWEDAVDSDGNVRQGGRTGAVPDYEVCRRIVEQRCGLTSDQIENREVKHGREALH